MRSSSSSVVEQRSSSSAVWTVGRLTWRFLSVAQERWCLLSTGCTAFSTLLCRSVPAYHCTVPALVIQCPASSCIAGTVVILVRHRRSGPQTPLILNVLLAARAQSRSAALQLAIIVTVQCLELIDGSSADVEVHCLTVSAG